PDRDDLPLNQELTIDGYLGSPFDLIGEARTVTEVLGLRSAPSVRLDRLDRQPGPAEDHALERLGRELVDPVGGGCEACVRSGDRALDASVPAGLMRPCDG